MNDEYVERLNKIQEEIYSLAGYTFNISSPKQVAEHLANDEIIALSDEEINKLKDDFEIEEFTEENF